MLGLMRSVRLSEHQLKASYGPGTEATIAGKKGQSSPSGDQRRPNTLAFLRSDRVTAVVPGNESCHAWSVKHRTRVSSAVLSDFISFLFALDLNKHEELTVNVDMEKL